jgi:kinesin family member 11
VDAQVDQVGAQMAALDEFVTRARSQNEGHHSTRTDKLDDALSGAQKRLTELKQHTTQSATATQQLAQQREQDRVALEQLTGSLERDIRQPLQDLSTELEKDGLVEYVSTGQTPRKRDWSYPSHLPRTDDHGVIIARARGLLEPTVVASTTPSTLRTPGRSPRKQGSPRKAPLSPSKQPSPSKTKVFADVESTQSAAPTTLSITTTIPLNDAKSSLKEIDINVLANSARPPLASSSSFSGDDKSVLLDFSKSVGSGSQQPPLKRHATANAVVDSKLPATRSRAGRSTVTGLGVENFSQSVGPLGGGRRLRSSPPE